VPSKGIVGYWTLSFPRHEMSCFAPPYTPSMMCCLATGPKATRPTTHVLKPPNL
jgi:hypothetical protein